MENFKTVAQIVGKNIRRRVLIVTSTWKKNNFLSRFHKKFENA